MSNNGSDAEGFTKAIKAKWSEDHTPSTWGRPSMKVGKVMVEHLEQQKYSLRLSIVDF